MAVVKTPPLITCATWSTTMLYDGLESAVKDENLLLAINYEKGKKTSMC
jgi:hypothetical protein